MRSARLRKQDGFIREILWLALVIAIIAVILLDGMAVFGTHQSVHDDAQQAATDARTTYADSMDLATAKYAAKQYLAKSDTRLVKFAFAPGTDGGMVFTITAQAHTNTYVFKALRYVGLKKFVNEWTNPVATEHSE